MKTPVWIPSLVLAVACGAICYAQNDTSRAALTPLALPSPIAGRPQEKFPLLSNSSPSPLRLSHWTSEIVQLAQSRIAESVMLAFIENSGAFNLGADQIVYLNDLGVSSRVVSAMLQHDRNLLPSLLRLTVTNESAIQPPAVTTSQDDGHSATKGGPASATPDVRSIAITTTSADGVNGSSSPEVDLATVDDQSASTEKLERVGPHLPIRQQSLQKGRTLYPVRAPYPVELTAPIVFLDAPSF